MIRRFSARQEFLKVKPLVKGIAAAVPVFIILSLIMAAAYYFTGAPETLKPIAAYFVIAVSAFVCGLFCGGGKEKNGFMWGTLGGVIVFILLTLISLITGGFDGAAALIKLIACAIPGCIGGIVGVNSVGERY